MIEKETNTFYDNTMLSCYRACPRSYYFRHVRDWRPDTKASYFAFGSGWHAMMDVTWALADAEVSDIEILEVACKEFDKIWHDEGFESDSIDVDSTSDFRSPGLARDMLLSYIHTRRQHIKQIKVIDFEKPFAVPLPIDNTFYIGRIDKIYTDIEGIWIGEHKTTSSYKKDGGFKSNFLDSFSPNSQIDGYMYSGTMNYGKDFAGVMVDAALVHRSVKAFKPIYIMRAEYNIEAWMWETCYYINEIESNGEALQDLNILSNDYLTAFPKNTCSCSSYQGYDRCKFRQLCKYGNLNPHTWEVVPENYVEDHWEPYDVLELSKLK